MRSTASFPGMLSIIAIYHKLCRMSMGKRTIEKLRILAEFIESRHGITLARAVSVNPAKMEKILSGEEEPSYKVCLRVADYFFIPVDILTDDG